MLGFYSLCQTLTLSWIAGQTVGPIIRVRFPCYPSLSSLVSLFSSIYSIKNHYRKAYVVFFRISFRLPTGSRQSSVFFRSGHDYSDVQRKISCKILFPSANVEQNSAFRIRRSRGNTSRRCWSRGPMRFTSRRSPVPQRDTADEIPDFHQTSLVFRSCSPITVGRLRDVKIKNHQ